MQHLKPTPHGAVVTTDLAFETLSASRVLPSSNTSTTPSTTTTEPRGAGRPVGSTAPLSPPNKKALLQKWRGGQDEHELDEEIYSIVAKPKRRFPKLLTFDENGTPVSARSKLARPSMKGPKRGRPRKSHVATLRRPRTDNSDIARNELERVQDTAKTRMHIKMNLRGRRKLENWLRGAKKHEKAALAFAVPRLDVDMRLLSEDEAIRRAALSNMPNADLRIVEALKLRCETKEGAVVWDYICGYQGGAADGQGQPIMVHQPVHTLVASTRPVATSTPNAAQSESHRIGEIGKESQGAENVISQLRRATPQAIVLTPKSSILSQSKQPIVTSLAQYSNVMTHAYATTRRVAAPSRGAPKRAAALANPTATS